MDKIKARQSEVVNDMEFAGDPLQPCRKALDESVQGLAKEIDKEVEGWSFVAEGKKLLDERGDK